MSGNKKQWYAMRKRLQEKGSWKGKAPAHKVPTQEEGEPPEKIQKEAPGNIEEAVGGDPSSDPEEGTSARALGKCFISHQYIADQAWRDLETQLDSLSWLGSIPRPGDSKAWTKSNDMILRKSFCKTVAPYYAGDGEWIQPLWKIAGFPTSSSRVHVLWLVQRPYFGL
uniref:Uncharacterized protein n=1 Tax=Cygnus atratus Chaphamaparvovirus TaxID=2794485 RepID=A0A8A4XE13_9VIRU|nr:MAG: hypothetical protein [Cygnus atratus Chaphamaparvovirus]